MSILNRPYFCDEVAAHGFLEVIVWPDGVECPHCGVVGTAYKITANPAKRVRYGLWKCRDCRKQFTVKVGTVFEHARLPLHKALQAAYLLCSSKKGISTNQLSRVLEISLKAAWFLSHRVREAMRELHFSDQLGGDGKIVEADETYFGNKKERPKFTKSGRPVSKNPGGPKNKRAVLALVERGGRVRSFHPALADGDSVSQIVRDNIARETRLHTDESHLYHRVGKEFAAHETVKHSDYEYVRGDVTTNTIESYFSVFKRGMRGTYQHCAEKHLHRYLAEFDFRYNNRVALGVDDVRRTMTALLGVKGKRLTYSQGTSGRESAF